MLALIKTIEKFNNFKFALFSSVMGCDVHTSLDVIIYIYIYIYTFNYGAWSWFPFKPYNNIFWQMLVKDSKCQIKAKWWPLFQRQLILGEKSLTFFQKKIKILWISKAPKMDSKSTTKSSSHLSK